VTIDEGDEPSAQPALLHRAWPIAALAFAVFVNVLWIGRVGLFAGQAADLILRPLEQLRHMRRPKLDW
jgi:hypothetical protein